MIVVLSNASDATADFLQTHLVREGVPFLRLNTERLARYPMCYAVENGEPTGWIEIEGERVALRDLRAVYYRRPRQPDVPDIPEPGLAEWVGNELRRTWGGVLTGLPLTWVNHPLAIDQASYKPEQLARAAQLGLRVPESLVTSDPERAREFCRAMGWEVVAKPVGRGWVRGSNTADDWLIYTTGLNESHGELLDRVRVCPTLLQRRIRRDTDVRVTVVGEEHFSADLRLPDDQRAVLTDCRRDNMHHVAYATRQLPRSVEEKLLHLNRSYGLAFAAIDLIRDPAGEFWFLELNPAGQWAWIEEHTGLPIAAALVRALTQRGMPSYLARLHATA